MWSWSRLVEICGNDHLHLVEVWWEVSMIAPTGGHHHHHHYAVMSGSSPLQSFLLEHFIGQHWAFMTSSSRCTSISRSWLVHKSTLFFHNPATVNSGSFPFKTYSFEIIIFHLILAEKYSKHGVDPIIPRYHLGKPSCKKNCQKSGQCPLWATPPPKRVKSGHLLSEKSA